MICIDIFINTHTHNLGDMGRVEIWRNNPKRWGESIFLELIIWGERGSY